MSGRVATTNGQRLLYGVMLIGVLFCGYLEYDLSTRLTALELARLQEPEPVAAPEATEEPPRRGRGQAAGQGRTGAGGEGRAAGRERGGRGGGQGRVGGSKRGSGEKRLMAVRTARVEAFAEENELDEQTTTALLAVVELKLDEVAALQAAHSAGELSDEDLAAQREGLRADLITEATALVGREQAEALREHLFRGKQGPRVGEEGE